MLSPRSILITGASSGIGAALARAYAAPGVHLALSGRDAGRLAAIDTEVRRQGATTTPVVLDVTDRAALREWIATVDRTNPIDLVIANAGISPGTSGSTDEAEQVRRIFAINIDGVVDTVLAAVPGIRCLARGDQGADNHAYFPILIEDDFPLSRDDLYRVMRSEDVLVRRYFHPLISDFPMYSDLPSAAPANLPMARSVSRKVLCLPIYPALSDEDVAHVVNLIARAGNVPTRV